MTRLVMTAVSWMTGQLQCERNGCFCSVISISLCACLGHLVCWCTCTAVVAIHRGTGATVMLFLHTAVSISCLPMPPSPPSDPTPSKTRYLISFTLHLMHCSSTPHLVPVLAPPAASGTAPLCAGALSAFSKFSNIFSTPYHGRTCSHRNPRGG